LRRNTGPDSIRSVSETLPAVAFPDHAADFFLQRFFNSHQPDGNQLLNPQQAAVKPAVAPDQSSV
jgi:hypothetical protein